MQHPDIHAEIRRYWENKNKVICTKEPIIGGKIIFYYEIYCEIENELVPTTFDSPNMIAVYTYKSVVFPDLVPYFSYQINGQVYDEATAVRLYKLLAFL